MLRHGRKDYPLYMILLFISNTLLAVAKYLENDPSFAVFSWFTVTAGTYLIISFLEIKEVFLNQKILVAIIVFVTLGGGILVNFYIFVNFSEFFVRIFSLSVLFLFALVYSLGIIAYLIGRKERAGKILNWILKK